MRFFSDSVVFFLPTCLILSRSTPLPAFAASHSLTSFPQLLHTKQQSHKLENVIYFPNFFILNVLSHEQAKSSHPFLLLYGFMYLYFIFQFHVGSFFFFLEESTLELLLELMLWIIWRVVEDVPALACFHLEVLMFPAVMPWVERHCYLFHIQFLRITSAEDDTLDVWWKDSIRS